MSGFIKRNRICGCDCRDSGAYVDGGTVFNPLACADCGGDKPPCHYLAHWPCDVKTSGGTLILAAGDQMLLPVCPFQNSCHYSELVDPFLGGIGCTSTNGSTSPSAAVKFDMDIAGSPVVLSYVNGGVSFSYTAIASWDCYGPNSLSLTAQSGGITGLPTVLCITPDLTNYCNPTCNGAACQGNNYDTEANRLSCCDPNCDDLAFSGQIGIKRVDGTGTITTITRNAHGTSTGVTGINAPSGPSYGVTRNSADFSLPFGEIVRGVFYCSAGTWYVDWYVAQPATPTVFVLISTSTFTSSCCPLQGCTVPITVSWVTGSYYLWAGVGAVNILDCFPHCCADADETNCHVTVTSSCAVINGRSVALTRTGSHTWSGSPGFGITASLACLAGVWTLIFNFSGTCGVTLTSTNVVCTPAMSGTFSGGTISGTACGACASGDTISVVLTI